MGKLIELKHLFVTVLTAELARFMVVPAITDVTMSAVCPGVDQCSLAIYLSGLQQAVTGIGAVVITPVMGSLSDDYGRKALLTVPLIISIIPLGIMSYSRETSFFYAYYALKTIADMVSNGSILCLSLAYVADNIGQEGRTSAFGLLSGILMASLVLGTLISRFLPISLLFQAATLISIVSAVYMRIFLMDKVDETETDLTQPILKASPKDHTDLPPTTSKKVPRVWDIICLLKSSITFSQLAVVAFFHGLSEGGFQSSAVFYWKALFHFTKNQYADLYLLLGVTGMLSQMILLPLLARRIREETLLSFGLFMGFVNMFAFSIAWSNWVAYAATGLSIFAVLASPSLRSIVSKQTGANEQGKAQGCISSISSAANIIAPLIFSPLTALFLSEEAPFNFPGFSILCLGFASMIAFIVSVMIKGGAANAISSQKNSSAVMEVP